MVFQSVAKKNGINRSDVGKNRKWGKMGEWEG